MAPPIPPHDGIHGARRGSSTPNRATESLCISGVCAARCLGRRWNLLDLGPLGPSVGAGLFEQVQIAENLSFEVSRQCGIVFHFQRQVFPEPIEDSDDFHAQGCRGFAIFLLHIGTCGEKFVDFRTRGDEIFGPLMKRLTTDDRKQRELGRELRERRGFVDRGFCFCGITRAKILQGWDECRAHFFGRCDDIGRRGWMLQISLGKMPNGVAESVVFVVCRAELVSQSSARGDCGQLRHGVASRSQGGDGGGAGRKLPERRGSFSEEIRQAHIKGDQGNMTHEARLPP